MRHLLKFTTAFLLLTVGVSSQAQFRAPGGLPPGFHHALLDVLTGGSPFTARARITVGAGTNQDSTSMSANIAVFSGSLRLEVDSFAPGRNVPHAEAANLRSLNSITLLRPDTNRMYLIYPSFNSYVELAYGKSTGMDPIPPPAITKTALGKEQVGIQKCDKSLWSVTENNGEHYDVTIWTSTNFHNFPIQIQVGVPPTLVEFENLNFEAPDRNLFVPPANYIRYEGIQEMILKSTQKAAAVTNTQ